MLKTIPQFARERGWLRRTALRRLLALRSAAGGVSPWLVRVGRRWLVNDELLREEHPGLFRAQSLTERVELLEAASEEHSAALAAMAPMVRDLRRRVM